MGVTTFVGPDPSPGFKQQVAGAIEIPLTDTFSGEITGSSPGKPIGAPRYKGSVQDVWLSIGASGKDDTNTLSIEVDVMINGTSCLTTAPKIAHVSGEASTNKTTRDAGDTGITQAVLDGDNNTYEVGDSFMASWTLTRTASPTTEMANAALVVELKPD